MKMATLSTVVLLLVFVVGCGGGSSGPTVPAPTAEEQTEIKAMHEEKAKEAQQAEATTPPDAGEAK